MKTLDPNVTQKTTYCIPLSLRDHQIELSIKRVAGRIQGTDVNRTEPVAIACFGPSLNDTWEELKNFKYIISCSGSHKFLVDRGIIPTWHVEVDPRAHKTKLIGTPHKDVEYLIASTCHPAVFDLLEGFNVKLWHVFDNQVDAIRTLPTGEWAITGGSNVGLRCLTIARFLGFVDLHIFGMDGCEGVSGKHAAEHPNQPKDRHPCVYDGVTYFTTPGLLECARQTWHELDQLPDATAKFYGQGLVQAMAKNYVRKPVENVIIGFNKPALISPEYVKLNAQLHKDNWAYGIGGDRHADTVLKLSADIKSNSILDYGCGKGRLAKAIPFGICEYDPAIQGKDTPPKPADLVTCFDVLEHVEPDRLLYVLKDLHRCTIRLGYFIIHTGPSTKKLADGRNAHLIQEGKDWWLGKLRKFFIAPDNGVWEKGPLLHFVVSPKNLVKNLQLCPTN